MAQEQRSAGILCYHFWQAWRHTSPGNSYLISITLSLTMTSAQTPSEIELKNVLTALRNDNPTLGVPKLHALLLATRPTWAVSEKRARKILQNEGLVLNSNPSAKRNTPKGDSYPKSKLIENLDVSKFADKAEVHYFNAHKGKGLLAKQKLNDGEVVWKEDPFVLAPEWFVCFSCCFSDQDSHQLDGREIFDLQMSSLSCAHCSTPLIGSSLVTDCPGLSSSPSCPAKFCSRLCLSRSAKTHPLLCRSRNPASAPLLNFARKNEWMALHALAQCTARLLLDYQQDESLFKTELGVIRSFAQLGMEQRAKQGS